MHNLLIAFLMHDLYLFLQFILQFFLELLFYLKLIIY